MRNSEKIFYIFKSIFIGLPITVLVIGLPYAVILGWAWVTDMKHARVAETVIDGKASEYIESHYPDNDFVVGNAHHIFKDNCYRVKVKSVSSQDTYFQLDYDDKTHDLIRDSYESAVLEGRNTYARITDAYSTRVQDAIASMPGVSRVGAGFCQYSENISNGLHFSPKGLDIGTLEVDQGYDLEEMGNAYGYIEMTFQESQENVNIICALEKLKEADSVLAGNGLGYYVMEVTVANGEYPDDITKFVIYGVTKADLACEDPLARLQELWEEQEADRQARKAQREQAGG